ncbi:anamorsin [Dorcoceras hygrometricum]|uniref:Anamorsin n=1 Tax=Dorcoceras hygrometricum TaxID=472368 RepID=A0A2Z7CXG6_9LAMI|nr:anamorsin [Dorcoceras hygrometricum]
MWDIGPVELLFMYYELMDPCVHVMRSGIIELTPYERASLDMLARITRMLERQSERSEKSHEEDVAERFRKQGPKEILGTTDPLVSE